MPIQPDKTSGDLLHDLFREINSRAERFGTPQFGVLHPPEENIYNDNAEKIGSMSIGEVVVSVVPNSWDGPKEFLDGKQDFAKGFEVTSYSDQEFIDWCAGWNQARDEADILRAEREKSNG